MIGSLALVAAGVGAGAVVVAARGNLALAIAAGLAGVALLYLQARALRRAGAAPVVGQAVFASGVAEAIAVLLLAGMLGAGWLLAALVARAILWWRQRDVALASVDAAVDARRWFPWIGAIGSALPLLFVIFIGRMASLATAAAILCVAGGWLYKLSPLARPPRHRSESRATQSAST